MNKLIALVWVASTALLVFADTWVDPQTGITWHYRETATGSGEVGLGDYPQHAIANVT